MRRRPRILFVGASNGARTQMAEGYMRKLGAEYFEVQSAGLRSGRVSPSVATDPGSTKLLSTRSASRHNTRGTVIIARSSRLLRCCRLLS